MSLAAGISLEAARNLPESIRVLIADDHRLFSQALEAILATDDRIEIAGHARDGRGAVELARTLRPHVILMDIAMPIMDGFQATKHILSESPTTSVRTLTGSNGRPEVDRTGEE